MKPHSMEEKISYRLFLMGFLGLLFTAALCIFVFHRAFTAQAWDDLEKESDLIRAGYDLTSEPQQLSFFVTGDLRITLISPDGDVIFESATDQPMENHLTRPEIVQALQGSIGKDIRDSQTMGYETYYYAVQLPGGSFFHSMMPSIWDCSGKERLYFRLAISIKDCTSSRGVWRMAAISTVTGG